MPLRAARRSTPILVAAILFAVVVAEAQVPADSDAGYSPELGLPYAAPGRGQVDHAAIRRRSLAVLERQFDEFRHATAAQSATVAAWCAESAPRADAEDAFRAAYLAWAPLDNYQFGPVEKRGAALAVGFWPDPKGFVRRGLRALIAEPEPRRRDPSVVAAHSAAVQGFPALERLLYGETSDCPAMIGISAHLAETAELLHEDWFGPAGWADLARSAGPANPVYRTPDEFTKELYTAVNSGLQRIVDARLRRPLGTPERPRPRQTEAWRSGLSLDLIRARLDGLAELIRSGFAGDLFEPKRSWVLRVFRQLDRRVAGLEQPLHVAVSDPDGRSRVETLRNRVRYLMRQLAEDIGPGLGVDTGFSSADGD